MEYRVLGKTGLKVSRLGFGGIPIQRIDAEGTKALMHRLLEAGVNYIDSARGYTVSEEYIGYGLEGIRDKFILATKGRGLTKQAMQKDLETSLHNFRTDYIDLYQFHNPSLEDLEVITAPGGALEARAPLSGQGDPAQGGEPWQEKVSQIRLYSGAKFTAVERAEAGQVCAVTGLTHTWPGEGLGLRPDAPTPVLEPAMTYQVLLDDGQDPHEALQKLRQLAEEDPQLHISWDEETRQIRLQPMGPVQLDVLRRLAADRFGLAVAFGSGAILYKETIAAPV